MSAPQTAPESSTGPSPQPDDVRAPALDTDPAGGASSGAGHDTPKQTGSTPDSTHGSEPALILSRQPPSGLERIAQLAQSTSLGEPGSSEVSELVETLIHQGFADRASDIHLESRRDALVVRFRVDGALRTVLQLPGSSAPMIVGRVKVLASMNILEHRRGQDGHFRMRPDGQELDLRVSVAPTVQGEKAVLRLLAREQSALPLPELGMPDNIHTKIRHAIAKPHGMLLCTGPTGVGKTTTLYAALAELHRPDLNVMTIEDPVEYTIPGVNQMQIDPHAEVDFHTGLRTILRQDPDVILIGEIRDTETATIAVQAALSGHLVLSSFHATDAASALHRLVKMGVEPFLIVAAVTVVAGQRLVRKVCADCARPAELSTAEHDLYCALAGTDATFMAGDGCERCGHTGYYGRTGVYELVSMTEQFGDLLLSGASTSALRELAAAQGTVAMERAAATLAAAGTTTVEEVARHITSLADTPADQGEPT